MPARNCVLWRARRTFEGVYSPFLPLSAYWTRLLAAVTAKQQPPPPEASGRPEPSGRPHDWSALRVAGPGSYEFVATLPDWMKVRIYDPAAAPWRIPDTLQPEERLAVLDVIADIGTMQPQQREIARQLRLAGQDDEWAVAEQTLRWVQQLGYVDDPPGDWYQGTLYTISAGARGHAGDCEDLAAELVVLLRLNGIPAWMWWVFQDGAALNHVTTRTKIDGTDFWAEASIEGAELGENPYHAARRLQQQGRVGLRTAV